MRACAMRPHGPVLGEEVLDERGLVTTRRLGRRNMNSSGAAGSVDTLRKVCVVSRLLPCPPAGCRVGRSFGELVRLSSACRDSSQFARLRTYLRRYELEMSSACYLRKMQREGDGTWNIWGLAQISTGRRKTVCLPRTCGFLRV